MDIEDKQTLIRYLPETLLLQGLLYLLAGLVLDDGLLAGVVLTAIIIHWIVAGVIVGNLLIFKNRRLTKTDLALFRFGHLIYLGLFGIAVIVMNKWR